MSKNEYIIEHQYKTLFKPVGGKKNGKTPVKLFCKVALKIIGFVETSAGDIKSWALSCTFMNKNLVVETKTIILDFNGFSGTSVFESKLRDAVGYNVSMGPDVTTKDIKDYKLYLEAQYTEPVRYVLIEKVGYIGKGTWFLNDKNDLFSEGFKKSEENFILENTNAFAHLCLDVDSSLHKEEHCVNINKDIYKLLKGFGINQWNAEFGLSFVLSRLLLVTSTNSLDSGESNILLFHSGLEVRNVGKTLLQKFITFGQGASLHHKLIVSGGSGSTSGTSSRSLQQICKSSNMVLCVNETKNGDSQSEMLIHLHERFFQGSKTGGLEYSDCSGIVLSSNFKEPNRLQGRVLSLEFVHGSYCREDLDKLYDTTKRHKGFLIAWVIHFSSIWTQNFKVEQKKIAGKLKQYLPECCQDDRWQDSVALVLYTKFTFCSTLGLDFSLVDEVKQLKKNHTLTKRSFWLTLETKLRGYIDDCDREQLTSWLKPKVLIDNKRKIAGFALATAAYDEIFPGSAAELQRELGNIFKQAFNQSVQLSNNENQAEKDVEDNPAEDERKEPKTSEKKSTRCHKIPKRYLSEDFVKWLEEIAKGNLEEYLCREIPKSERITDDDIDLESCQFDMNESLNVTQQNKAERRDEKEEDNEFECVPERLRALSETKSPKSKLQFLKGCKETMEIIRPKKRRLDLETDFDGDVTCMPSFSLHSAPTNGMISSSEIDKKSREDANTNNETDKDKTKPLLSKPSKDNEKDKDKTKPLLTKPSQSKPSQSKPSQSKPSQSKPSNGDERQSNFPPGTFGVKGMTPFSSSTPKDGQNYGTKQTRQTDYSFRRKKSPSVKSDNETDKDKTKPLLSKPSQSKPSQSKPSQSKPSQSKPSQSKPLKGLGSEQTKQSDCRKCPCGRQDISIDDMLMCDKCFQSYHGECAGVDPLPDVAEEWFCQRCDK